MHTLILGITDSGKSYLAKKLAREFRQQGRRVAVLNPIGDAWPADFQTEDPPEFLEFCRREQSLAVFVDESGDAFETGELTWLATRGRHFGHSCFFIAQRYAQVPKTVRAQCRTLYLFCSHRDDGELLAGDFNDDALAAAHELPKGEFLRKRLFEPVRRYRINFKRGSVEETGDEPCARRSKP